MSTLATLMYALRDPGITPYNQQELTEQRIRGGMLQNQTSLLALEEARRQQQAEAAYRQAVQQHPGLLFGGGSQQPLLAQLSPGALPQTGGPPGAITQQAFGPSGPGATQTIPAPMDLSRFATGTPPPGGPVLASVGQPQEPVGGAQEVLFNLARQNPDAALLLQRGMQQQEDMGYKRQEQGLKIREKVAESFGQLLGGAHDQASYDVIRRQLAQVSPEWAAALPQTYSAEGVQPFIDAAISAKDRASMGIQSVQAQAELTRARMAGRVPTTDQYLKALGVRPGEETPEDMQKALAWQQQDEMSKSAAHGTGQIVQTPQGFMRINPRTNQPEQIQAPGGGPLYPKPTGEEQKAATFGEIAGRGHQVATDLEKKGFTPGFWEKMGEKLPFGMGNYLQGEEYQKYHQAVNEFAQAWLRKTSGAAVQPSEWEMTERTYFPRPGDSKAVIEQKRAAREALVKDLEAEGQQTGRQPGVSGGQTRQAPPPQGPATFDRADFLRWRQGTGKTGNPTAADVEAYFQARGLTRR